MASDSSVIETVFTEMDIIKEEQLKIINYNAFLEDRRQRFIDFILRTDLQVSEKASENLINCVPKLEIKVLENPEQERASTTLTRKCRHNNKGYCKHKNRCGFYHHEQICENFVKDGSCEIENTCPFRHPKECKYTKDSSGCKRGGYCRYLHKDENEIKSRQEEVKVNQDVNTASEDMDVVLTNQTNNDKKFIMLQKDIDEKDAKIKELEEIKLNLEHDISNMKSHVEKLERIAFNMHKELKGKK